MREQFVVSTDICWRRAGLLPVDRPVFREAPRHSRGQLLQGFGGILRIGHADSLRLAVRHPGRPGSAMLGIQDEPEAGSEFLELVPGERVMVTWHEAQQDEFSIVADRVERS